MKPSVYVLDANVLIEAKNLYYAFDLVPGFWSTMELRAAEREVCIIDRVADELLKLKDQLSQWVRSSFWMAVRTTNDQDVVDAYRKIMNWVHGQSRFTQSAKATFASVADGWIVAYALAPDAKNRVKIPNVCMAF